MYKISVPVICNAVERQGREKILNKLRQLNAERVFLALGSYEGDPERRRELMECLRRECEYFHSQGFEVGSWCWTFMTNFENPYTKVHALQEQEHAIPGICCPTDPEFRRYVVGYVTELAEAGVDLIMFDDDFRYSSLAGGHVGCLCPNHRARINELVGEELDHATLARRILTGGKNKYRDAWIQANGESFRGFARELRAAVDAVNPKIRMGACACLSSWDLDGIDAYELSRELAGSTRPFVRLIGASYWAARNAWGNRMGDVVEQERMEAVWTRQDGEIEIFSEGDCYPRPRIICPAAYVEGLDTALRADGSTDGMLKYAIDYTSSGDYENGYVKFHLHNKPVYEGIDRMFSGKRATGVRVYEYPKKVADMELGDVPATPANLYYSYFSGAARAFAQTAIPTTYEGEGVVGACFGEAAHSLTHEDCKRGMILDGSAAAILAGRGFDVGILEIGPRVGVNLERFLGDGELVSTQEAFCFDHRFSDRVVPLSMLEEGERKILGSYLYENADGERFLVINADGRVRVEDPKMRRMVFRHYARAQQYREHAAWLSRGDKLPASVYGEPDLYLMAKKDTEGNMTVGLWNFSVDAVLEPVVDLDGDYAAVLDTLSCSAALEGDHVRLSEIPAFGFAAFTLKK